MRKIKVRIIGSESECYELEQILRQTGRVKTVRRIDRSETVDIGRVYSRTFGSAPSVYYLELTKKNRVKGS